MQVCGTCGAKSWGPLTSEFAGNDYVDWLYNGGNERPWSGDAHTAFRLPLTDFYRCDNCGVWALKSAVDHAEKSDSLTNAFAPAGIGFEANPFAGAATIMDMVKRSLPTPETRMERLVKAILGGSFELVALQGEVVGTEELAKRIVLLASFLDIEVDREYVSSRGYVSPQSTNAQPPDAEFPQV